MGVNSFFFLNFAENKIMDDKEYVDFYCEYCLEYETFPDFKNQTIVFNDLHNINEEQAISNAEKLDITEKKFTSCLKQRYDNSYTKFNIIALWKISLYLFQYIFFNLIYITQYRSYDEYLLYKAMMLEGFQISSIKICGTINGKNKTLLLKEKDGVDLIKKYLDSDETNNYFKSIEHNQEIVPTIAYNYYSKSTITWLFARELTNFFCAKIKSNRLPTHIKELIMYILDIFECGVKDKIDSLEKPAQKYNKIMSDAKKGKIDTAFLNYEVGNFYGILQGFSVVKNSQSAKIAKKYYQALNKSRKNNNKRTES